MAVLGCDKLWHNDISRRKSFRNWDISIKIQRVKLKLQAYNISTQNNQTKEGGKEDKREEWSWEYDSQKPGDVNRNQNALIEQPLSEKSN